MAATRIEEFAAERAWWGGPDRQGRVENEYAWRVPVAEIKARVDKAAGILSGCAGAGRTATFMR